MGGAILRGLRAAGDDRRVVASARSDATADRLRREFGIEVLSPADAVAAAEVVLIGVKPQQLDDLLGQIEREDCRGKLVVSILAGTTTRRLEAALPGSRVVRAMPNTPLTVGRGCVSICRGASATAGDLDAAKALFPGAELFDLPEGLMDAATAVGGSGPAYFFAFVEALAAAGVAEGLMPDDADRMARRTFEGAAALLAAGDTPPAELRRRVTSPGGTTAAALESFAADDLPATVGRAVSAATARGRELSED